MFLSDLSEAAQSAMKESGRTCSPEVFGWEEMSELTDSSCWVMYSEHCDSNINSSDEVTACDKDM